MAEGVYCQVFAWAKVCGNVVFDIHRIGV